jgi:hypothetical protein
MNTKDIKDLIDLRLEDGEILEIRISAQGPTHRRVVWISTSERTIIRICNIKGNIKEFLVEDDKFPGE